jgi:imidazoleglycerol phosphate synthase glutamine amidotransferase subunit HisH
VDVAVVDYGVSNLCSVVRAVEYLGYDALLTSRPEDLVQI